MDRWHSFQAFKQCVYPDFIDHSGPWRMTQSNTIFENVMMTTEYFSKFVDHYKSLKATVSMWPDREPLDATQFKESFRDIESLACDGEYLLLFFPSLGESEHAGDFRSEKDLHISWRKSHAEGFNLNRFEIDRLLLGAEKLINEFYRLRQAAEHFLLDSIDDLEVEQRREFKIACDLFSIGMDEAGAFFAGRGLESTLRKLAKTLKMKIAWKRKTLQLHEMDLSDMAEAFRRFRWKATDAPVIDSKTKALINLLRVSRNFVAHAPNSDKDPGSPTDWREISQLSARAANSLWMSSGKGRKKLQATTVPKDW